MAWDARDAAFVTAIERRYLAEVGRLAENGLPALDAHNACLATAIHRADPTNGGLRFRGLDEHLREELESRLRRAYNRRAMSTM